MDGALNYFLIVGAAMNAVAALLHAGCIFIGAACYRTMGAGEQMARLDLAGHWYPKTITSVIVVILSVWAIYALSGAGVIRKLPLVRLALCAITGIYLLRAVAFMPLQTYFPDNSMAFWLISSGTCLVIGVVHLLGLRQAWSGL